MTLQKVTKKLQMKVKRIVNADMVYIVLVHLVKVYVLFWLLPKAYM